MASLAADDSVIDLCFTLEDRLDNNGLVVVVVMKPMDPERLFVENWLMSCRVLKRGMENFTLNTMVERAKQAGYRYIVGEYLPTAKNGMVADHYRRLGFKPIEGEPARYLLDVDTYQARPCFIKE